MTSRIPKGERLANPENKRDRCSRSWHDQRMSPATNNPETGRHRRGPSRRKLLLVLVGSLASVGLRPPVRAARPMDDIVIIDGWILRVDDMQRMSVSVG